MNKNVIRLCIIAVLFLAIFSSVVFATGVTEKTITVTETPVAALNTKMVSVDVSVKGLGTPYFPLVVTTTPKEITSFFVSHGINSKYATATLETMPPEVRNELRILYADKNTREAMNALATEVLKKYLKPGQIETVTASYGPFTWTVSYEQVTEEKMETPQQN